MSVWRRIDHKNRLLGLEKQGEPKPLKPIWYGARTLPLGQIPSFYDGYLSWGITFIIFQSDPSVGNVFWSACNVSFHACNIYELYVLYRERET
jgi:hypothetical protein